MRDLVVGLSVMHNHRSGQCSGFDYGAFWGHSLATGIAFVVIALAGTLQAMRTTVSPADGPLLLLFAFEAVIIGGMGSFWGTLVGALVLGLTQQVGFRVDPGWGLWAGHLMFLAVLVLRPQGLFPKTRG